MRVFTVSGLSAALGRVVDRSFPHVAVEGEVSQVNVPRSGHAYMVLRDGESQIAAICWASTWKGLRFQPRPGQRVVCTGAVRLYAAKGILQLYVNDIRPKGEGQLAAHLEKIKQRLEADGLLDPRRKRPLPAFPRTVGIATSLTGAALQDFLRVASRRWPAHLLVAGCTVQGEQAAASVVRALELLFEDGRSDVVVVTRGGGSKLDLLPFHDETLARWIATAPVPVVSAVGHETDTSISDLVADAVAPTPSAAAMAILPDAMELRRRTQQARQRLQRAMGRHTERRRTRLTELQTRLKHPSQQLATARHAVDEARGRLERAFQRTLQVHRSRLAQAQARLDTLSPYAVLDRGYALVQQDDRLIRHPDQLRSTVPLTIRVAGGTFTASIASPISEDPDTAPGDV